MQKPKQIFKPSFFLQIITFSGGFLCFGLGGFMLRTAFHKEFVQVVVMGFGLLFCLFGMILFRTLIKNPVIKVFDKHIEFLGWFGLKNRKVLFNEVSDFGAVKRQNKKSRWQEIKVFTPSETYHFSSHYYDNLDELRQVLNRHLKDSKWEVFENQQKKYHWIGVISYGIFGLLLIISSIPFDSLNSNADVGKMILIDELASDPDVDSSSKGGRSVTFQLKKYPDFVFSISGSDYYGIDVDAVKNNLKQNDTLFLSISTRSYQIKIERSKEPTFIEKSINWNIINTVQVFDEKYVYFSKPTQAAPEFDWWLFIVGIGVFAFAIYYRFDKIP
jgi:hypothetical protein